MRKADQKHIETFKVLSYKRMEKISWTDRVRNEEVLQSVKEEMNILHKTQRTKANWIGHILHTLKTGGTEVTGKRGRRRKQLLNDLMKTRG